MVLLCRSALAYDSQRTLSEGLHNTHLKAVRIHQQGCSNSEMFARWGQWPKPTGHLPSNKTL